MNALSVRPPETAKADSLTEVTITGHGGPQYVDLTDAKKTPTNMNEPEDPAGCRLVPKKVEVVSEVKEGGALGETKLEEPEMDGNLVRKIGHGVRLIWASVAKWRAEEIRFNQATSTSFLAHTLRTRSASYEYILSAFPYKKIIAAIFFKDEKISQNNIDVLKDLADCLKHSEGLEASHHTKVVMIRNCSDLIQSAQSELWRFSYLANTYEKADALSPIMIHVVRLANKERNVWEKVIDAAITEWSKIKPIEQDIFAPIDVRVVNQLLNKLCQSGAVEAATNRSEIKGLYDIAISKARSHIAKNDIDMLMNAWFNALIFDALMEFNKYADEPAPTKMRECFGGDNTHAHEKPLSLIAEYCFVSLIANTGTKLSGQLFRVENGKSARDNKMDNTNNDMNGARSSKDVPKKKATQEVVAEWVVGKEGGDGSGSDSSSASSDSDDSPSLAGLFVNRQKKQRKLESDPQKKKDEEEEEDNLLAD